MFAHAAAGIPQNSYRCSSSLLQSWNKVSMPEKLLFQFLTYNCSVSSIDTLYMCILMQVTLIKRKQVLTLRSSHKTGRALEFSAKASDSCSLASGGQGGYRAEGVSRQRFCVPLSTLLLLFCSRGAC